MYTVLICDDDRDIVSALEIYLTSEGYRTVSAYNGEEAIAAVRTENIDLILMDVMMPRLDGIRATAKLREEGNIPIILLTAKSEDTDKVLGLNIGADDYITKPFNLLELKARIRAMLRRASGGAQGRGSNRITVGELTLDTEQRVAIRDGKTVELTAKEYDLIELLMKNPRRVYSRENLMNVVWGYSYTGDYRTVDVHIRRLREKLERQSAEPEYIMTKWGVGYYFKG